MKSGPRLLAITADSLFPLIPNKIAKFPVKSAILPPQKLISSPKKNRYDKTVSSSCRFSMDIKLLLLALTGIFTIACLFFGTKNGFYDSDDYHGNGSAH